MKSVHINLGNKSYNIYITSESWDSLLQNMSSIKSGKALIITDTHVHDLYYRQVSEALEALGIKVFSAVVPPGESSKSLQQMEQVFTKALEQGLDRHSSIIALGGGVIGDLAGFIAATYMRGIPFVQIPTSLLAQVDSSIGGKVAVNHPHAKNVIGAFYQPKCVLMNMNTLKTLPARELSTGMAELIKHGIIWDDSFLHWLDDHMYAMMNCDIEALTYAIMRSSQIKGGIVEQDEMEHGIRAILNFGHTVGHALETITAFTQYTHGEAVSIGCIVEAHIALLLGWITEDYLQRIKRIFNRAGLPTQLPSINHSLLIEYMKHDKKNMNDNIVFVLPRHHGKVEINNNVPQEIILEALKRSVI